MALTGRALLIIGLLVALYGAGASLYGARTGRREWIDSGRRSVYALAGLMTIAFVILESAFLRSDFTFNVVAGHSSTTTPTFYKLTAPWSSQEGSLLLWVWLLSLWSSLVLFLTRGRVREIAPYATAVLLGFASFFSMLTVFWANPFATTHNPPTEGAGLDPLLLHPSMMIHPPMLYSGYTLLTIPFAFAVGALITGRLGSEWIAVTRRFALAAWLFLGIGILLGARWSYTELGWGGYWAWDPVENAALMPWLAVTAFIHSAMIQEKRGMLKVWNASLILGSATLAIIGTFLVRSGVLDSIHAFGASTLGIPFVLLIGAMVAGSIWLVVWRRPQLRSDSQLDSLLSREAVFLFQNVVLVAMVFVIFWVTFFPLISEAVTGTKVSVGPPAFRPFIVPLALVLVLLSGIGPIIAWRRVTAANLRRNFTIPVSVGVATLIVLLVAGGGTSSRPFALVMFALAAFVVATVVQEFWRGVSARRAMTRDAVPIALGQLVRRNRRRYGGYIVHAGLAVLLVGVAASSSFQHSHDVTLKPGQSRRRQRLHDPLCPPDRVGVRPEDLVRRRARRLQEGQPRDHAADHARLLPGPGREPGGDRTLLQRPGRQQRGPRRRDHPRHLDGDQSRSHPTAAADQQGRQAVRRRRGEHHVQGGVAAPGPDPAGAQLAVLRARRGDHRPHASVRDPPVGGELPDDRLAACHLDLAGRADHRAGRADRAVAGPRARAAAGHLAGGGGRRRPPAPAGAARARTGL